eukprot:3711619-Ditylum_brightwellii.AAC.1
MEDYSDADKAGSPHPSVVGSGAMQDWRLGLADLVQAQIKGQLLSQMQMKENTTDDNKTAATSESGDNKMP